MKRTILYISGIVIILLLVAVWVYLLFYGTPKNIDEVFTDLGLTSTSDTTVVDTSSPTPEPEPPTSTIAQDSEPLQQLTTRTIAGFRPVTLNNTTYMYYVEKGTGHIFRINQSTNQEERVSATTIPLAHDAHISPNGQVVVLRSRFDTDSEVIIGRLSTTSDEMDIAVLDEIVEDTVFDIYIGSDNQLLFTTKNSRATKGFVLDLSTFTTRQLFDLPLPEARIVWGARANTTHFVHTLPAALLPGYLYEIGDQLNPLPLRGNGLVAFSHEGWVSATYYRNGQYISSSYNRNSNTQFNNAVILFPEKCTYNETQPSILYCGGNTSLPTGDYPDDWYQGEVQMSDKLWSISTTDQQSTLLSDLEAESGRIVDVSSIEFDETTNSLFFTNHIDGSLWSYKIK